MERVLVFQVKDEDLEKLRKITGNMKIKVLAVEKEDFKQTIGDLLEQKSNPLMGSYGGETASGSMIVLDGFSDKRLDTFLNALKREQTKLDYKAVTTTVNKKWTVLQMYLEMERERSAYLQMMQK
ncbi:MAG: DUF3783 domain-containing protein [Lachnospiraceae bacterium]|nr:DUF3783 domain-containing protein [Lachnospiraceae bacterium]